MTTSIERQIVDWANGDATKSTPTQRAQHLKSTLNGLDKGGVLTALLDTVKHPYAKTNLSAQGIANLQSVAQILKEEAAESKGTGFVANLIDRYRKSPEKTLEKGIDRELLALQKQKLLKPDTIADSIFHAQSALPHMSKAERREFCDILVGGRQVALSNLLEKGDPETVKAVTRVLFKNGHLHLAFNFLNEKKRPSETMIHAMKEGIKEELKLQPRWAIAAKFSSSPTYAMSIPAQGSSRIASRDSKEIVDSIIADAAFEKVQEQFKFPQKDQVDRFRTKHALFAINQAVEKPAAIVFKAKDFGLTQIKKSSYELTL